MTTPHAPKKVIAVLRHGDYFQPAGVPSAHLPYALNPAGEGQAIAAAGVLADFCLEHDLRVAPVIDSSRLRRAWQTASLIAKHLPAAAGAISDVAEFSALAERSVGAAANLTVSQIEAILADDPRYEMPPPGWKSDARYRLPLQGAESLLEAGERVAGRLVQAFRQAAPGELKIVVGHGASIRHAAVHLGLLSLADVGKISMFHAMPVYLTCIDGRWHHIGGDWKVRNTASDSDEYAVQRHGQ